VCSGDSSSRKYAKERAFANDDNDDEDPQLVFGEEGFTYARL